MTTNTHRLNSDARRRQIRLMQLIFAGAATFATLALVSAGPANAETAVPSGSVQAAPASAPSGPQAAPSIGSGGSIIAVDDNTNPSSGDIFTQNAQDQSTANGAGT